MIIEISAKNLAISPTSRSLIAAYIQQLRKYFRRIYTVKWSFEVAQPFIKAHLFVHAHSGDYRTSARGKTIREILVTACDSVERQRRRRKRIAERSRRAHRKIPSRPVGTLPSRKQSQSPEDFGV